MALDYFALFHDDIHAQPGSRISGQLLAKLTALFTYPPRLLRVFGWIYFVFPIK
jgi:hypothetical protein